MSPLYLYAVTDRRPDALPRRGVRGERLRAVPCGSLYALVGTVAALPLVEPDAIRRQHAVVTRLSAGVDAILPARFGSSAGSREELEALIVPREADMAQLLALVRGREQMTLRVFTREKVPGAFSPEEVPGTFSGAGPGARYLAARRAEADAAFGPDRERALRTSLAGIARATRVQRHAAGALRATLYHLVDRGAGPDYGAAVERAARALADLHLAPSGPWPPYAFAEQVLA